MPLVMSIVPRVTMNGGSPRRVTSVPLNRPIAAAQRCPSGGGHHHLSGRAVARPRTRRSIRSPVMTAERAITLPTERSIPPVMMTTRHADGDDRDHDDVVRDVEEGSRP